MWFRGSSEAAAVNVSGRSCETAARITKYYPRGEKVTGAPIGKNCAKLNQAPLTSVTFVNHSSGEPQRSECMIAVDCQKTVLKVEPLSEWLRIV